MLPAKKNCQKPKRHVSKIIELIISCFSYKSSVIWKIIINIVLPGTLESNIPNHYKIGAIHNRLEVERGL